MLHKAGDWLFAVLIGLDVLLNALIGGKPYMTVSCRIGLSIQSGGWASHVPWPGWLRQHFASAVFTAIV